GQGSSVALALGTAALGPRHEDEPEIADAPLVYRVPAQQGGRLATNVRRHQDAGTSAQRRREFADARRLDDRPPAVEQERAQVLAVVEPEGEERAAAVARASERLRERARARDGVEARQDDERDEKMHDGRRETEHGRGGMAPSGALRDDEEHA